MDNLVKLIENKVEEAGFKLTHARKSLILLFVTNDQHYTVDEIYQILREDKVSLPTVYRNLALFKNLKIIKELEMADKNYYELNMFSQKKLHIHFQCTKCEQIKEYKDLKIIREMLKLTNIIESDYRDIIEDTTIIMKGLCSKCKER